MCVCASYVMFVLSLFVSYISTFWCFENDVRECGNRGIAMERSVKKLPGREGRGGVES